MIEETQRIKFLRLSGQYAHETRFMSMVVVHNPSYIALLSMGQEIVPWLLEDLQSASDTIPHYDFDAWAHMRLLRQLTQSGPIVPENLRGKFKPLIDLWVSWGIDQGYLQKEEEDVKPKRSFWSWLSHLLRLS